MVGRAVRALAVLLLLVLVRLGAADGGFFGKMAGAELTIPDQRAIIVWHEGQQTLFVESNLRAAAGEYSWVIPLPAPPTEIGKARPSVMDLVFGELVPLVHRRPPPELDHAAMLLITSIISALIVVRWPTASRWSRLAILFAVPALVYVMYPVYGHGYASKGAGGPGTSAVQVLDRQTIGSYEVAVVKSTDAAALEKWLDQAGTPLPSQARKVIEAYVREGWCFMTARFRKEMEADAKPHPVRIKFPAAAPIYPMRLTGVVSDKLDLDLVVIGPEVAECKPLRLLRSREVVNNSPEPVRVRRSLKSPVDLRHVDIAGDLPANSIATRLRGVVSREQMQQDYSIGWQGKTLQTPVFYTEKVARARGQAAGFWAIAVFVLLGAAIATFRPVTRATQWLFPMVAMGLASVAVGGVASAATPTIEVEEEARRARPDDTYVVDACVRQAFEGAQTLGFDPFRVRFERGLRSCAKAIRSKSPPESWLKDDVGGYLITEVAKDEVEVQLMDAWGQIERMKFKDRPVTPSDPVVRTTVRLVPGPERLVGPARRSGILSDWAATRLEFKATSGKVFTARKLKDGRYEVKLPAGEFRVWVKSHILHEPVTWAGKERLKVPFQREFAAQGEFDLSRYFWEP